MGHSVLSGVADFGYLFFIGIPPDLPPRVPAVVLTPAEADRLHQDVAHYLSQFGRGSLTQES